MPNLYPTINLPTIAIPQAVDEIKYLPSPKFDFETGDFILGNQGRMTFDDGREAFEKWCVKVCMVERGTRLAYSDLIGIEYESIAAKSSPDAVKSALTKTITEAILVHPAAEAVKDFEFKVEGDVLNVSFTVKAKNLGEVDISVEI